MKTLRSVPPSDHFDGHRFFNPGGARLRSFGDFLRWRFSRRRPEWPEWIVDEDPPMGDVANRGEVAATYIGHATVLLRFAGLSVLTDPMFSLRASPLAFLGP